MANARMKLRRTSVARQPFWNSHDERWELLPVDEAHKRTRVYQVDEFDNEMPPTSVAESKGWVPYQYAPEAAKRKLAKNAVYLAMQGINPHEHEINRQFAAGRGLPWESWEKAKSDATSAA